MALWTVTISVLPISWETYIAPSRGSEAAVTHQRFLAEIDQHPGSPSGCSAVVARILGVDEVGGSIPPSPTISAIIDQMDKYYLRAIRLAAKNKIQDRWIHSQWYQPLDAEDAGTTFVLIEVINQWFPSPQIATTITNTFNREYFRQRRVSSANDAFETAVRRVNEALAARADEGETDWIGNLHAVLAVVAGTEFHVVATGKAIASIFRDGQLNPAVQHRPTDEPPAPLATFVNLSTGTLEPGDKGVLATPDLFEYVSAEELATSLSASVEQAGRGIVRLLQAKRVKTPHVVLFDFSATPHPERKSETEDTIFLDVPLEGGFTRMKDAARKVVAPVLARGTQATGSAASWFWGKTKNDFIPALKKRLSRQPTERAAPSEPLSAKTFEPPSAEPPSETPQKPLPTLVPSSTTKPLTALASLMNQGTAIASRVRFRPRLFFIALALVVLAVVGVRFFVGERQREVTIAREAAQRALVDAQDKKKEADLALIYKENERALDLFLEAITLAKTAGAHPDVKTAADEVLAAAQQSVDELTDTVRVAATNPYAQFRQPTRFVVVDRTVWAVEEDGTVLPASASGESKEGKTLSGLGLVIGVGYVEDHRSLFVVGKDGVGRLNIESITAAQVDAPGGAWQEAVAAEAYSTNLYFLDPADGQIWKYSTTADAVNAPTTYFSEKQDLTTALDLGIDGRIYVLFADGTINRYFRGVSETFIVSGIPKPYEKLLEPKFVATDSETANLYVFDKRDNRIVELSKTGTYQRQFALPPAWDVKDLRASGENKKLFVLAGSDVFEIAL